MLGVLSSTRHPLKMLVFRRCGEMLQKSLKPIRKSFAPHKEGTYVHVLLMVGGVGRAALYLKVSPNGLWPAARSRPVAGFTR